MDKNEKVLIRKETLKELESKLNVIKVTCNDEEVKDKIAEILKFLEEELTTKVQILPIKEIIYLKMKETKGLDPELHFKLYKLHRKLSDGQITEEEALKAYQLYT